MWSVEFEKGSGNFKQVQCLVNLNLFINQIFTRQCFLIKLYLFYFFVKAGWLIIHFLIDRSPVPLNSKVIQLLFLHSPFLLIQKGLIDFLLHSTLSKSLILLSMLYLILNGFGLLMQKFLNSSYITVVYML